MQGGPSKWYIDTIDGRGGLAFATWRVRDLEDGTTLFDRPVFHFSPPDFAPIPVASPATALAAERHGFQLGLLDAEGEVPFDSLADVAEFVRRVYIGSGRSDGTDGGGIPPVPPPAGEPPDLPPDVEGEEAGVPSLRDSAASFLSAVKGTPRGSSKKTSWDFVHEYERFRKSGSQSSLILVGAAMTLIEMLARFPTSGGEPELERWQSAASRLVATLIRTGAVYFADDHLFGFVDAACQQFLRSAHGSLVEYSRDWWDDYPVRTAISLMANCHPEIWLHGYLGRSLWFASSEPLDDLAHFPVKGNLAKAISAPNPTQASVADLLSATLAFPGHMANTSNLDAIVAFAAARIVAFDGAAWTNGGQHQLMPRRSEAQLAQITGEAYKWLARELPILNFSPSIEALLARSSPFDASNPKDAELVDEVAEGDDAVAVARYQEL
jgi:hypothetical protein